MQFRQAAAKLCGAPPKVDPGDPADGAGAMQIPQKRIAVVFTNENANNSIMKVVDLEGRELATYDELKASDDGKSGIPSGAFTCYTENPTRFCLSWG